MPIEHFFVQFLLGSVIVCSILVGIYFFFWVFAVMIRRRPNHEDLLEHFCVFPSCSLMGNTLRIDRIRDWRYDTDKVVLSKDYISRDIDITHVGRVWFIVEHSQRFPIFAHTYFSFEIEGAAPICVSAEGIRREGESPNAISGALRRYGIMMYWGSEEDFIIRRTLYLGNTQRMYLLDIGPDSARTLFLEMARYTNWLTEKPQFYNTFFGNCTNTLGKIINATAPGFVRFWFSGVCTGLSAQALHRRGRILPQASFDDIRESTDISDFIRHNFKNQDFSEKLREFLEMRRTDLMHQQAMLT